jgi:branched-chain amino acid transport system substrate-binding protein
MIATIRARAVAGALLLTMAGGSGGAKAADPFDIHALLSLTGSSAFGGQAIQTNLQAVELVINKAGGVNGRPVRFVYHDDKSSPEAAVQLATELLPQKPAAILVSGPVAPCNAVAPILRNGPVLYCLTPAFHPADPSYGFSAVSSSTDIIAGVMRFYRLKGWTRIAVLNTTDATGLDADKSLEQVWAMPENKDLKRVEFQHFNPNDVTIAAQMARIKAAEPQALIAWVTGSPLATVMKGMAQAGLDIPVAPSTGNQIFTQVESWVSFLPPHYLQPSAIFPEHDGLLTLDPRVEQVQHNMYAALKERGLKADNNTGAPWDPALMIVAGLNKIGPNATADQLRQYITGLTDFPGIDGIYDFKKYPERGLGPQDMIVTRYDVATHAWVWLSKPGGEPLAP